MDDEKIIALFLGRDESAIRETDIKYGGYCRSISRRILNSDEDIEECVSDAYLKLWNTIPPKRPPSLKTYLGSIVRNLSINRLNSLSAAKRNKKKEVLLSELELNENGSWECERLVFNIPSNLPKHDMNINLFEDLENEKSLSNQKITENSDKKIRFLINKKKRYKRK